MNEIETRQQYVEEMLKEVIKSFPEVEEDEIKIIYDDKYKSTAGYSLLNGAETKKEPCIFIGSNFFSFSEEEQEGFIAHEIGHHETLKNHSIPSIKRSFKWNEMYYSSQILDCSPHWKERLKKRHMLNEMSADNKIAHTKYGKIYLDSYKEYLSPFNENSKALIKNLEEKLGIN